MPDYQQSKIYQIVCLTTGECYIGSTTQATLAQRLSGHCAHFKAWKNGNPNFVSSFTIIERGNYRIELIESFPCESRDQLNAREGFHIRNMVCVNKIIIGRTYQEWNEANKEVIRKKDKAYYQANKESYCEKAKAYYQANKEVIREKQKAYREKCNAVV